MAEIWECPEKILSNWVLAYEDKGFSIGKDQDVSLSAGQLSEGFDIWCSISCVKGNICDV